MEGSLDSSDSILVISIHALSHVICRVLSVNGDLFLHLEICVWPYGLLWTMGS
jgi:hypothetical protein